MQTQHKNSSSSRWAQAQSGQAIILLALALVALIGMLGLAIDGGGLFFLQRDAQNASDAAVLAATYAVCTGTSSSDVVAAGKAAAASNGFIDGQDQRTVSVQNPAPDAPDPTDKHYVQVDISAVKPPFFIQVVYKGPLKVSTKAIGYCDPAFNPGSVKAIMGLSSVCTGNTVIWSDANGYVEGGIYSNDNIQFSGSDNTIVGGADAVTTVDNPSSGNNTYTPAFTDTTTGASNAILDDPLASVFDIKKFEPTGEYATAAGSYYHHVYPGASGYTFAGSQWKVKPSDTLEGIYYVEGSVDLGVTPNIGPKGITIVATGDISGSKLNSGVNYYSGPGSSGLLFYTTEDKGCGSVAIGVSGNSTTWRGVVYAPHAGVSLSNANGKIYGYVVAYTVQLSGANLQLIADPTVLNGQPPLVSIVQ